MPFQQFIKSKESLGFVFVALAGIGFGFLGIFGKLGFLAGLTVAELLTFRFLLASVLIGCFGLIFKPNDLRLTRRQIIISSLLGMSGYAVFSTLYFKSIEGLSVGIAAMLLFCFPFFVLLGEVLFFKKRLTLLKVVSLILCMGGLILLIAGPDLFSTQNLSQNENIKSLIPYYSFALFAALTYSIYVLVSGHFQQETPAIGSSFFVIFSAGMTLLFFNFSSLQFEKFFNGPVFAITLGIAIVCTVLPICFFLLGLQRLSSGTASLIVTIEPVVAAIAGVILLDEKLIAIQVLGCILVLMGIILIHYSHSPKS